MKLGPNQERALRLLSRGRVLTAREVADRLDIKPNGAHDVLNSLERAGYVQRESTRPLRFTRTTGRRYRLELAVEAGTISGLLQSLTTVARTLRCGGPLNYDAGIWTTLTGARFRALLSDEEARR